MILERSSGHQKPFYGTGHPVFPTALGTFKSQLRGTRLQQREELKYTFRSALAKLGIDFNKDVYSKWIKRHMKCTACGGTYFDEE